MEPQWAAPRRTEEGPAWGQSQGSESDSTPDSDLNSLLHPHANPVRVRPVHSARIDVRDAPLMAYALAITQARLGRDVDEARICSRKQIYGFRRLPSIRRMAGSTLRRHTFASRNRRTARLFGGRGGAPQACGCPVEGRGARVQGAREAVGCGRPVTVSPHNTEVGPHLVVRVGSELVVNDDRVGAGPTITPLTTGTIRMKRWRVRLVGFFIGSTKIPRFDRERVGCGQSVHRLRLARQRRKVLGEMASSRPDTSTPCGPRLVRPRRTLCSTVPRHIPSAFRAWYRCDPPIAWQRRGVPACARSRRSRNRCASSWRANPVFRRPTLVPRPAR